MIRYSLKCADDHHFESWFRSAEDFDGQLARGLISCPECGTVEVQKSLMAPKVRTARAATKTPKAAESTPAAPQSPPSQEQIDTALAEMRQQVETSSDYVGMEFANEARKMHEGESEARAIYGEAKIDDAKKLIEDGVPVTPLPFKPRQKMT